MKNNTTTDYYLAQLANPLTAFLDKVPRGEALRTAMNKHLPPLPDETVWGFPVNTRLRLNANLAHFHLAMGRDIDLAETIMDLLEVSYASRRPTPRLIAQRRQIATDLAKAIVKQYAPQNEAIGRALTGCPGSGKTRTITRVLAEIPQVIELDVTENPLLLPLMVTWIRVEAPSNRKMSALIDNIITAIESAVGEKFEKMKRGNISIKLQNVAMLVMEFNVGLIVIDEIQHVLRKNCEPDLELMNFLVELSNRTCVPLLLVGTPQSEHVAAGTLRQARRMIGRPWSPLAMASTPWTNFSTQLLGYQFTKDAAEYADLEPKLFDLCQGLPAIAVTLFQLAQKSALLLEIETGLSTKVTPQMLDTASSQYMHAVAPMLEALRNGNESQLALYQDIKVDPKTLEAVLMDRAKERDMRVGRKLMRLKMDVSPGKPPKGHSWRHDAN